MTVIIAGAGIAGLSLGLSLHQIGVPFRIYEAVQKIGPLGVGINLQPNAVRELFDLGLEDALDSIGVRTQSYGFHTKTGLEIWREPRGTWAGYYWPQFSVHRGRLQMLLHDTLVSRAGRDCIVTGHRATGFTTQGTGAVLHLAGPDGPTQAKGSVVIAADGIHSALRTQMYPGEGPPIWGGAILWRGTTRMAPFLGGADMALAGHDTQRIVTYPISAPDPDTGLATINWIAELRVDPAQGWRKEDWNRAAKLADFAPAFADWRFDWLDVPAMIAAATEVFEYPMVDRDPIPRWTNGAVTLMGDAAHPTYPVGSNGASQAIVDARQIAAMIRGHGQTPDALIAFESLIRPRMEKVILANRGSGPDAVLQMVEDRCGGTFDDVEDVIPRAELAAHADRYKALAGFGVETLNAQLPILPVV
ncbi:flavin-dependent oxidoreductase [Sulfitobacter sabulilitoris]|uniref:Flavin-dependent oxidoreductase n=1 Tax=Sulfitobacter sabulilitoris TaxID=2562655 RepID=A0A5S3PAT9_9RHOB|nr:flavin-dependent oxidoreductase [Sulfitobacter sabulilitoris]TMM50629.1 flavin-dependent oxidoreductase [Sulfitobacter sabulilitoris]